MIAGLEVPHAHIHLVSIHDARDLDFDRQDSDVSRDELEEAAERIREAMGSSLMCHSCQRRRANYAFLSGV